MLWLVGKTHFDLRRYLNAAAISYGRILDLTEKLDTEIQEPIVRLLLDDPAASVAHPSGSGLSGITAVLTDGYERYIVPTAKIADHLGLPGIPISAAMAATDKSLMRAAFSKFCPDLTPDWIKVKNWPDITDFMSTRSYPVVLKPTNLSKSRYVTVNHSLHELRQHYLEVSGQLKQNDHFETDVDQPALILETFLVGSMHTVAGFIDDTGQPQLITQVADCQTAGNIGVADSYLFSRRLPSALSSEQQKIIVAAAALGCRALGLRSCAVHVECILTADGPKIIEIGARNGGYRAHMYASAFGVDLYQATVATAFGQPVDLVISKQRACRVFELFPEISGQFIKLDHEVILRKLPTLTRLQITAVPDQLVGPAAAGFRAVVIIFLEAEDDATLEADSAILLRHRTITVLK